MNDIKCPACGLYVCRHSDKLRELLDVACRHEAGVKLVGMPFSVSAAKYYPALKKLAEQ